MNKTTEALKRIEKMKKEGCVCYNPTLLCSLHEELNKPSKEEITGIELSQRADKAEEGYWAGQLSKHDKPTFKVGDRVEIKSWDEIKKTLNSENHTGSCRFDSEMERLSGTTLPVLKVLKDRVKCGIGKGDYWHFMNEWIKPVEETIMVPKEVEENAVELDISGPLSPGTIITLDENTNVENSTEDEKVKVCSMNYDISTALLDLHSIEVTEYEVAKIIEVHELSKYFNK